LRDVFLLNAPNKHSSAPFPCLFHKYFVTRASKPSVRSRFFQCLCAHIPSRHKPELSAKKPCMCHAHVFALMCVCEHHCAESGMPRASVTWPSCRFLTSCASQRLVAVSSFSTWANVLSFSWSGRHWRRASRALWQGRHTATVALAYS